MKTNNEIHPETTYFIMYEDEISVLMAVSNLESKTSYQLCKKPISKAFTKIRIPTYNVPIPA